MKLLDSKIVLVSGKGGVGKSSISLALAARASLQGKRVLLVELGTSEYFSRLSGQETSFSPISPFTEWPNLQVARWTGAECLTEYVQGILRIAPLVNAFLGHSVMKALIEAAPALSDVSLLGKLTSGVRDVKPQLDYDLVVLDAFSMGHFLAMIKAPLGLYEAIRVGPMGSQSQEIHQVLCNKSICSYAVVCLPEEMAAQEAEEICEQLKLDWGAEPVVFCNQTLPEVELGEEGSFTSYLRDKYKIQNELYGRLKKKNDRVVRIDKDFSTSQMEKIGAIVESFGVSDEL